MLWRHVSLGVSGPSSRHLCLAWNVRHKYLEYAQSPFIPVELRAEGAADQPVPSRPDCPTPAPWIFPEPPGQDLGGRGQEQEALGTGLSTPFTPTIEEADLFSPTV